MKVINTGTEGGEPILIQQGKGVQTWANGAKYDGMWHEGQIQGYGILVHQNGDVIEGNFHQGKATGYAKFL